jgi:hypothetical protein
MYYFPLLQIIIFKKKRKLSFIAVFANKLVIATEKTEQLNYSTSQQTTEDEVGHFLYFHCK